MFLDMLFIMLAIVLIPAAFAARVAIRGRGVITPVAVEIAAADRSDAEMGARFFAWLFIMAIILLIVAQAQ